MSGCRLVQIPMVLKVTGMIAVSLREWVLSPTRQFLTPKPRLHERCPPKPDPRVRFKGHGIEEVDLPELLEGISAGHVRVQDKEGRVILAEDFASEGEGTGYIVSSCPSRDSSTPRPLS